MTTAPLLHSPALLLVGHGTRDPEGVREFEETVRLVRQQVTDSLVAAAFLELAQPDISTAIDDLVARGATDVVLSPVLLFAAGHAKKDFPKAIHEAKLRHPNVSFTLAEPLKWHPSLLELSCRCFETAAGDAPAGNIHLILVGRGSSDQEACADTARYAEMLAERLGVRSQQTAFMAVAKPLLSEVLAELDPGIGHSIVVQPHLLFQGQLLKELRERVAEVSRRLPALNIFIAPHLGPSPLLVGALLEVARLTKRGGSDT